MNSKYRNFINHLLNQFSQQRGKLFYIGLFTCLCVLVHSCTKNPKIQYPIHLPDRELSLEIDTNIFNFEYDSNKVYNGDPILHSFVNKLKKERLDVYIGSQDPTPEWKYTFDFLETYNTIEEQVAHDIEKSFILKQKIQYWQCPGNLVQFSQKKLGQKIESQFICLDSLRVNIILTVYNKVDEQLLLEDFRSAIRAISLNIKSDQLLEDSHDQ